MLLPAVVAAAIVGVVLWLFRDRWEWGSPLGRVPAGDARFAVGALAVIGGLLSVVEVGVWLLWGGVTHLVVGTTALVVSVWLGWLLLRRE